MVSSGNLKIQVVGTQFNVNAYLDKKEIVTTLLEGCVQVYERGCNQNNHVLKPNDQLVYNKENRQFKSEKVDLYYPLLWRKGTLALNSKTLEEILVALNRKYQVDFTLPPHFQSQERYKVLFQKGDSLKEAMNILSHLIDGFSYQIINNSVFVKVNKD